MNKHVKTFEDYFDENLTHFTMHDRKVIAELLVELKAPAIIGMSWSAFERPAHKGATEIQVCYESKTWKTTRHFYINGVTYWQATGRDIFEVIGDIDAAGDFEDLGNSHLHDALFAAMHMGDDDVSDAVFDYQFQGETLKQVNLRRHKGLVKIRWPQ